MSKLRLSYEEVKKRLLRLRNVERLYAEQKVRIKSLSEENRLLKQRVLLLEKANAAQQKTIDDLKLQIEELRVMVFGKKKQKDADNDESNKIKTKRAKASYQRPLPKDDEITETRSHTSDQCPCGTVLIKKRTTIFYEEDIPIPAKKIIIKHSIEKGYCPKCRKQRTAIPLPSAKVILGINVQKYICYLNIFCRLSFYQIQQLLFDTYQLTVSQGEIVKILNREAVKLRPHYEQLKEQIRGEPGVHLDETGWRILTDTGKSYAWVMSGAQSKESVFLVGESRGKGNAEKLLGGNFSGFVVSDDYGAYRKLNNHQLCWAHLLRKFRDLVNSQDLAEEQKQHCKSHYEKLCLIFYQLNQERNPNLYDKLVQQFIKISIITSTDPKKLIRLKTTLCRNISKYLTCLSDPNIPLTNNQAERSLRHLVLKRKISFGSANKKTAENLAVLLSVTMSLKQRYQSNFFGEYLRV